MYAASYMQKFCCSLYTVHCDTSLTYVSAHWIFHVVCILLHLVQAHAVSIHLFFGLSRVQCTSGTRKALKRIYQCMQFLFDLLGTRMKMHVCTLHTCFNLESSGTIFAKNTTKKLVKL